MPRFAIVVAADEANGIGRGGRLPWRLPGDMAYFKRLTSAAAPGRPNVVIMGRKTWQSIPARFRPLAERVNVVVTRNAELELPAGVARAGSLDAALEDAGSRRDAGEVFVIGGGEIFRDALAHPSLDTVYLTRVHATLDCDTFLPAIPTRFALTSRSAPQFDSGLTYTFDVLTSSDVRTREPENPRT
jgi:dihydrofolate reductase